MIFLNRRPAYTSRRAVEVKMLGQMCNDLRHTAATLALTVGVSPKVVSEQLGHTSAAFTLDVYSHVLPHMQDDAAAKVEAALIG